MSNKGINKYVQDNFKDKIVKECENFFESHRYMVREELGFKCYSGNLICGDSNINSCIAYDKNDKIGFDIIVMIKIFGTIRKGQNNYVGKDLWLNLLCEGTIETEFKDFNTINVRIYDKIRVKHERSLNEMLVPYIKKNELDFIAEEFLRKYYPKALLSPINVDSRLVAEKMGLKVCKHNIVKDKSIFGRIFFEDTLAPFYDASCDSITKLYVDANTIVYDPNSYFMSNIEKENNNTIIHECVHFYLHRYAIKFQKIFDKKYKWFDCDINGRANMNLGMDINIMEWQANALTPRILMPYKAFSEEAFKLIKEFRLKNNSDTIDILPNVIETLSNLYHVSKLSVKIRLCDIGITEAYGCDIWCDDYKVPDFSFEPGTCEYNETFVIPAIDAIALSSNPIISKMMEEQKLVYLESHLCLNSEKYIGKDLYGKKYIKYEARKKLNKFCIKMKMTIVNFDSCYERECLLNRNRNSKFHTKLCFEGKEKDIFTEANIMKILEEERKFNNAFFDLNNDYVTCMKMLKEKSGLTYEQIEAETEIELSSVKNIIAGKRNGSLLRLTLILMAIGAEPDSAYHVIDKSGVRLDRDNAEHQLCRFIINTMHADTMENIIKCVNNANFKI